MQQGRDIVAVAKTGSGKTLGYLVSAFFHIEHYRDQNCAVPSLYCWDQRRAARVWKFDLNSSTVVRLQFFESPARTFIVVSEACALLKCWEVVEIQ